MKNKQVSLRAPELSDIDFLYSLENDIRNWELSENTMPFSRYAIEQYLLSLEQDFFSIKQMRLIIMSEDTQTAQRIGTVELFDADGLHRRAGVGIIILEEFRNKGYASAALQLIIDYAFNILGLHQLYCHIAADNLASLNFFKKHDFVICGLKKDWIFSANTFKDVYMLQHIRK